MHKFFKGSRRIVLKIGSSLVVGKDNQPNSDWLKSLASDVAALSRQGVEVVIVTSGAVALGLKYVGKAKSVMKLPEKQAAAACGQLNLIKAYKEAFEGFDIPVAQILLTMEDSENRKRYLNARNTIETLLDIGVLPVINENDTVATGELKFGDNDRLSARVAQMIAADSLILFSDIDGLYTGDPSKDKRAKHIPEVKEITAEIEKMAKSSGSELGSGGMATKITAAKIALAFGCSTIITLGKKDHPVKSLAEGGKHTRFISSESPESARKNWIAESLNPKGEVIIDDGALSALKKGKSLLPAGVKELKGNFERGDAIRIITKDGMEIGRGLANYPAIEAKQIIGHKSSDIESILGFPGRDELIHRDDMVLK